MKLGIDIGGSHIAIGKVQEGKIIEKIEYNYDYEFKRNIRKNMEKYLKETITMIIKDTAKNSQVENKASKIEKIGISIAGRLRNNILYISPNLKDLQGINFVDMLEPYFGIPVTVNKDSFCAGKAEKTYGCLQQYDTAVFLIIGTGIGAISYRNGFLQRDGYGHMIIEKNGRQCKCGKKGCFETYGSITALKKEVKNYMIEQAKIKYQYENKDIYDRKYSEEVKKIEEMTGKQIHDFLEEHKNEEEVQNIIDKYIQDLCIGLSNIIDIVLPEAIGFGGSFSYYQDLFLDKIREKFRTQKLLSDNDSIPVFTMGKLKNDAGIIGATLF